jgi:hypothetical protein
MRLVFVIISLKSNFFGFFFLNCEHILTILLQEKR